MKCKTGTTKLTYYQISWE